MAGETIQVKLGGKEFTLPPLPISKFVQISKIMSKNGGDISKNAMEGMFEVILCGLQFAHKELTQTEVDLLHVENLDEVENVFNLVLKQAGLQKKPKEPAAVGAAPLPLTK